MLSLNPHQTKERVWQGADGLGRKVITRRTNLGGTWLWRVWDCQFGLERVTG